MAIVLNGTNAAGNIDLGTNGTITDLAVGGLPDGIVDTDMLAASAVTAAKSSGLTNQGVTHFDTWHVNTEFSGTALPITSNWETMEHYNTGYVGAAMTQSSGIFTFPVTGYWFLNFHASFRSTVEQDYVGTTIRITQNNSSYSDASANYSHTSRTGGANSVYSESHCNFIANIDDLSNQKVCFGVEMNDSNGLCRASGDKVITGVEFIRLGDT